MSESGAIETISSGDTGAIFYTQHPINQICDPFTNSICSHLNPYLVWFYNNFNLIDYVFLPLVLFGIIFFAYRFFKHHQSVTTEAVIPIEFKEKEEVDET